jgi:hypothetical protein
MKKNSKTTKTDRAGADAVCTELADILPASDPMPDGKYVAVIANSEKKPTNDGNGACLEITFQISNGPYKGRKLRARFN